MKKLHSFTLHTDIVDKGRRLAVNERRSLSGYIETLILEAWDKWQK